MAAPTRAQHFGPGKGGALCQRLMRPSERPLGARYRGVSAQAAPGTDVPFEYPPSRHGHTPGGLGRKADLEQTYRVPSLSSTHGWTPTPCRPCSKPHTHQAVWREEETVSVPWLEWRTTDAKSVQKEVCILGGRRSYLLPGPLHVGSGARRQRLRE